ncbi:MAG: hypothetical protein ACFNKE_08585, partial [Neisseria elongata]
MMKNKALLILLSAAAFGLSACGGSGGKIKTGSHKTKHKPQATAKTPKNIRIGHINRTAGGQELMLHSMDLVGTPYRWGGFRLRRRCGWVLRFRHDHGCRFGVSHIVVCVIVGHNLLL